MEQQRAAQLKKGQDKLRSYRESKSKAAVRQDYGTRKHDAPAARTRPRSSTSSSSSLSPLPTSPSSSSSPTRTTPVTVVSGPVPGSAVGSALTGTSTRTPTSLSAVKRPSSSDAECSDTSSVPHRLDVRSDSVTSGRMPDSTPSDDAIAESLRLSLQGSPASYIDKLALNSEERKDDNALEDEYPSSGSFASPDANKAASPSRTNVAITSVHETNYSPVKNFTSRRVARLSGSGDETGLMKTSKITEDGNQASPMYEAAVTRSGPMPDESVAQKTVVVDTASHPFHGKVINEGLPATAAAHPSAEGGADSSNMGGRRLLPEDQSFQDISVLHTLISPKRVIDSSPAAPSAGRRVSLPASSSVSHENAARDRTLIISGVGTTNLANPYDRGQETTDLSARQLLISPVEVLSATDLPSPAECRGIRFAGSRLIKDETVDNHQRLSGVANGVSAPLKENNLAYVKNLERRVEDLTEQVASLKKELEERLHIENESRALYEKMEKDASAACRKVQDLQSSVRIKEGMIKELLEQNTRQLHDAFRISRNRKFASFSSPALVLADIGQPLLDGDHLGKPGTAGTRRRKTEEYTGAAVISKEDDKRLRPPNSATPLTGSSAQKSPTTLLGRPSRDGEKHDVAAIDLEELRRKFAAAEEVNRDLNQKLAHELHINELLVHENSQITDYVVLYHAERRALIKQTQKAIQRAKRGDFSEPFPPPNSMISPTTPPASVRFPPPVGSKPNTTSNLSSKRPVSSGEQPPASLRNSPPAATRQGSPSDPPQPLPVVASSMMSEDGVGPVDDPVLLKWLDKRGSIAGGVTVRMEVRKFSPCRECRSREVVV